MIGHGVPGQPVAHDQQRAAGQPSRDGPLQGTAEPEREHPRPVQGTLRPLTVLRPHGGVRRRGGQERLARSTGIDHDHGRITRRHTRANHPSFCQSSTRCGSGAGSIPSVYTAQIRPPATRGSCRRRAGSCWVQHRPRRAVSRSTGDCRRGCRSRLPSPRATWRRRGPARCLTGESRQAASGRAESRPAESQARTLRVADRTTWLALFNLWPSEAT